MCVNIQPCIVCAKIIAFLFIILKIALEILKQLNPCLFYKYVLTSDLFICSFNNAQMIFGLTPQGFFISGHFPLDSPIQGCSIQPRQLLNQARPVVYKCQWASGQLKGLVKCRLLSLIYRVSDSMPLEWSPRIGFALKFKRNGETAGPGSTL